MPRLSSIDGIGIYMYYEDHAPPHIHARNAEHEAKVSIVTGEVLAGSLPRHAERSVTEWVRGHAEELAERWERVTHGEAPSTIEPPR